MSDPMNDVKEERLRQNEKWGEQNHSRLMWCAILTEEVGEVAKAALEDSPSEYREELVQVAAVAVAAIESHDRQLVDGKGT